MGSTGRRLTGLIAVVACAGVLVAGCSGSSTSTSAGTTEPPQTLPGQFGPDGRCLRVACHPVDNGIKPTTITTSDPKVGTLTFDALAAGDPARAKDGKLVLLLHGFPETDESYRDFLEPLAAAGWYAVAPNQRGYSPTARPPGVDAYGVVDLSTDVTAMATALGADQFHVVGHDWGGAVAWVTARLAPERVKTVTVLSTPHPDAMGDAYNDPNGEQTKMSGYMQVFRQPGQENVFLANGPDTFLTIFSAGGGIPEAKARTYVQVLGTPEALGAALNWYRANPLPSPVRLGPVEVDSLFIWGTKDMALGRTAAEATRKYVTGPYAFEPLEGKGHWLPEEASAEILPLLLAHLTKD